MCYRGQEAGQISRSTAVCNSACDGLQLTDAPCGPFLACLSHDTLKADMALVGLSQAAYPDGQFDAQSGPGDRSGSGLPWLGFAAFVGTVCHLFASHHI
jgi:hypothetical protein